VADLTTSVRNQNPLLHPYVYGRVSIRSRGYLPHWDVDEGLYSITYRLNDSLPLAIFKRICEERRAFEKLLTGGNRRPNAIESDKIRRFLFDRVDSELDLGYGECWMQRPEIADLVADSLRFFDGTRYDLAAWCVMPNHVHVVAQLHHGEALDRVCHSWKSYTSSRANHILKREGRFWEKEYFDRLIRSGRDLEDSIAYVLDNPQKAGLKEWRWVSRL
jgi:REP element-mobilizing transposase RayT